MRRVLIILFSFISSVCLAQTGAVKLKADSSCIQKIKLAETYYENGQFLECTKSLDILMATYELRKFDKVRALELAAKSSVEMGEMGRADAYVNVMLKTFPHYDLKEDENSESFNRLVKKYKVHPALSIGVRNTANWMNYNTIKTFSSNGLSYEAPYYKQLEGILHGFGFMYYGWGEIEFDRGISFNGDLIFKWTNFNRDLALAPPFDLFYWEQDNFMEIPIYLKKYFKVTKNTMAYATAGVGWLYLLEANGNADIYYSANDSTSSLRNYNMVPYRNKSTFEWLIGAGYGYKYRNLRMFFDARYYSGFNSITNPEKGATDKILVEDYLYIDNFVRLKQFELGVSISYTLFNSVKKNGH